MKWSALALVGLAGLGFASLSASALADDVTVDATYYATLSGFPIANGTLQFKLDGKNYDARISAQVSGLAALIASRSATGAANGKIEGNRVSPDSYSLSISGGNAVNEVAEQFINNRVVALAATELHLIGWDQRVPLLPQHKQGVVDPFGAFVIPMQANRDIMTPAVCNRTLKIFDGRVRYDLRLVYGTREEIKAQGDSYSGPAIVCAVAYRPIAGQRVLPPEQKKFEENIEFSIWFVPVGSTGVLLPHRILIQTQSGLLVVNAASFVVHGSTPIMTADASAKAPEKTGWAERHHRYRRHKGDAQAAEPTAADAKPTDGTAKPDSN